MNTTQIIKKDSQLSTHFLKDSKLSAYFSFGISIFLLLIVASFTLLLPTLYQTSNNITNDALKDQIVINLYNKSLSERKLNLTRVSLEKSIDQYNNLDDGEKTIALVILASQARVSLAGYQNIDNDLEFFSNFRKSEDSFNLYKKELVKMPEENLVAYHNNLVQLVKYYKELPYHSVFNNHKLSKILDDHIVVSNKYIKPQILESIYLFNNNLEHWKEIRAIQVENFNPSAFAKNPNEYWKENFAEKFGPEIPEYIKIHYLRDIDLDKAENWINNFKT